MGRTFMKGPYTRTALQKTCTDGLQYGMGAVARLQLIEDFGEMVLDGAVRNAERPADLLVGVAAGNQAQHRQLALGQVRRGALVGGSALTRRLQALRRQQG